MYPDPAPDDLQQITQGLRKSQRTVVVLFALEAAALVGAALLWFSVWAVLLGVLGLLMGCVALFLLRITVVQGKGLRQIANLDRDLEAQKRRSFGMID